MQKTLEHLQAKFPALRFVASDCFCWSPQTKEILYDVNQHAKKDSWALLHETGHALLGHTTYLADFELIRLEMAAWAKARELASELKITISEDHIQDCLDTYRDWLYKRSICPTCSTKAFQQPDYKHYRCFNCHMVWRVTPSRFARAYRSTKTANASAAPVFQLYEGY